MIRNAFRGLLVDLKFKVSSLAFALCFVGLSSSAVSGQVVAFPSWANDPGLYDPTPSTAPPYPAGVAPEDTAMIADVDRWRVIDVHGCWVESYFDSGVLAVRGPQGAPLFGLDTGLDYIYEMERHEADPGLAGFTVCGRLGADSKVLYLPWSVGILPQDLVFSTLLQTASGHDVRFAKVFASGVMYTFEMSGQLIQRWEDTEGDGLPNSASPSGSIVFDENSAFGVVLAGFGEAAPWVSLKDSLGLGGCTKILSNSSGSLQIQDLPSTTATYPTIVGQELVEGLGYLRLGFHPGESLVGVRSVTTGQILAKVFVPEELPFVEVQLRRRLQEGEWIQLESDGGVQSELMLVRQAKLTASRIYPYDVEFGASVELVGAGYSASTNVQLKVGDGAFVPCQFTVLNASRMIVTLPPQPVDSPGGVAFLYLTNEDSAGVVEEEFFRPLLVIASGG